MKPLSLEYIVPGDDFTRAGEASSKVKNMLKRVGYDSDSIRRVAIAMYEGEINMVIHGGGGVAQPRLKIQKKESAQSRPQQGAEPGPADACGGDGRQRPWAVQAVQRRAGQQKRGGRR